VCPELEVCHEHHSPPPIAPAQKRSDCMCETRFKVGSKNLKKKQHISVSSKFVNDVREAIVEPAKGAGLKHVLLW